MLARVVGALALVVAGWGPAEALTFRRVVLGDGRSFVEATGPIGFGDAARLQNFLDWLPAGAPPLALSVDSPGGSVAEASSLAETVRLRGLAVAVLGSHSCASACFLLFAAAPQRLVGANALVGVHSASMDGRETMGSMAVTTAIAREAKALHVPPAVIGKLVSTAPDDMSWLSVPDLREMGAVLLEEGEARQWLAAARATVPEEVAPRARPQPVFSEARPAAGLEEQARAFVGAHFGTWSADNGTANGFIGRAYAPVVEFYGKPVARDTIVNAKQAYTVRWPVRDYRVRQAATNVSCEPGGRVCSVTGLVDWDCRSPQRNARSEGAATFALRVDFSGGAGLIVGESGGVVSRGR